MEKRDWHLFIHPKSLNIYAIPPGRLRSYQSVISEYIVVEGLTRAEAEEDVARSIQIENED